VQRFVNVSQSSNVLLIAILSMTAVAVNFYGIALFDVNQIILGNAFAIALTIIYGLRIGLPVALVASLVTAYHWQHFYGTLPFILEVVAIAVAMRRQKSVLLAGVLYWLTLGWLLVALLYGILGDYSEVVLRGIVLKYILNGLLNVLLGFALFHAIRALRIEPRVSYRTQLSEMLVNTGLFIVLFVASLVIYFWLRAVTIELFSQTERKTQFVTQSIADRAGNHFEQHHLALQTTSQQLADQPNTEQLQRAILAIHNNYPEFITLLVTDAEGDVIATSPIDALKIEGVNQTINVADRDYFYNVAQTLQPFSSNAFRGRGFGNDPIVALSVPYYVDSEFAGVIEGSLNLTMLANLGDGLTADRHYYIITDSNNRVVFASPEFGFDFLDDLSGNPLLNPANTSMMIDLPVGLEDFILDRQTVVNKAWLVTVAGSLADYEKNLGKYLFFSLLLLFGLALLSIVTVLKLTNKLTAPIAELVENLRKQQDFGTPWSLTKTNTANYVHELTELQQSFHEFTMRLHDTLTDLRTSNNTNSELNRRLQQANDLLEERVKQRTEQLEVALHSASAANNVKSQFLANMSHEVRTPLHGILGLTEILMHDPKAAPFFDKLELIEQSGKHLLSIVDDILDLAKTESGKIPLQLVATPVVELVEQLVAGYQSRTKRQGVMVHAAADQMPKNLLIDPTRFRQIIENLLSNAIKFTPHGEVEIRLSYQQPMLQVMIKDSGIGIASDRLEAVFEPFEQADSSTTKAFGGTGLGLTISRQIARLMGGDLRCESQLGEGSLFILTIDAQPAD